MFCENYGDTVDVISVCHNLEDKPNEMRTIKITEEPESNLIDFTRLDDHDVVSEKSGKMKEEERKYYEQQQDKKDKKYQNTFSFPSKYHYFIFLIMFQNSNEMIPITVRHSLTFSGGKFIGSKG